VVAPINALPTKHEPTRLSADHSLDRWLDHRRLNHGFGIGPVVDFSIGEYSDAHYESGTSSIDQDIQKTAAHAWLTLGVRFVFFP
jgi:hypothetical protein